MVKNRVGLGTFPLASVFNPITPQDAEKLVREFIDDGGYYFDTAPLYGNGEIEKLLGRVLKSVPRDRYYLSTKTVKHVDENGKLFKSGTYKDVVTQFDNSLKRLNVDYVDLLMAHQPDEDVPLEETLRGMIELKRQGKVKELAVSNVNLEELKAFNQTGEIRYVQNRFSVINRSLSPDFEKYILENNIHLIPYHLLEIGLLTGIAFEDYHLREGDLREKLSYWNQENQQVIFAWVRTYLAPLAKKIGCTIGQLNIAWALHQKYIDYVVVGTTKPEYLKINLAANNISLKPENLKEIESAYKKLEKSIREKYGKTMREFRGLNEKYY